MSRLESKPIPGALPWECDEYGEPITCMWCGRRERSWLRLRLVHSPLSDASVDARACIIMRRRTEAVAA